MAGRSTLRPVFATQAPPYMAGMPVLRQEQVVRIQSQRIREASEARVRASLSSSNYRLLEVRDVHQIIYSKSWYRGQPDLATRPQPSTLCNLPEEIIHEILEYTLGHHNIILGRQASNHHRYSRQMILSPCDHMSTARRASILWTCTCLRRIGSPLYYRNTIQVNVVEINPHCLLAFFDSLNPRTCSLIKSVELEVAVERYNPDSWLLSPSLVDIAEYLDLDDFHLKVTLVHKRRWNLRLEMLWHILLYIGIHRIQNCSFFSRLSPQLPLSERKVVIVRDNYLYRFLEYGNIFYEDAGHHLHSRPIKAWNDCVKTKMWLSDNLPEANWWIEDLIFLSSWYRDNISATLSLLRGFKQTFASEEFRLPAIHTMVDAGDLPQGNQYVIREILGYWIDRYRNNTLGEQHALEGLGTMAIS
ncbi:MAG: hypothetical protein M1814_003431 [Vezdaea aestivalis]|nr:MAG: hypothetical protein M1814_003431 [Vezdaea aestivalis]